MMTTHPLVSVCVPCYNHQEYIEYCLNSIKNDTYPNKEIIIIDDGSVDQSVNVINKWKTNNPNIINTFIVQANKGLCSTLNDLIAYSTGEYICFLGSDDVLFENSILNRMEVLLQNPHKYAIIGDAVVIDSKNKVIFNSAIEDLWHGDKNNYKTDEKLKYSVVNQWSVPGPVLLVKKDIYNVIGMYPANLFAEDIYFYLKVIGLNLLIFIDTPVAYYRRHSNNTCCNEKNGRKIRMTFVLSYLYNLKHYHGSLRRKMVKLMLVWLYYYVYHSLRSKKQTQKQKRLLI